MVCSCSAFASPAVIPCENGYTVKIDIIKTLNGKFRSHNTDYGTAILEQNGKTLSTVKLEDNESYSYTREGSIVRSIEFDYDKNNFAVFVIDQGYLGFDGHASDGAFTLWAEHSSNKCLIEQVN